MLCQYYYELTPRQSQELTWICFVSLHSAPGQNIPGDLHQEHFNRVCKECIRGLGPNKTEKAITRVGKALGTLRPLLDNFDSDNNVADTSGAHKKPSSAKDRDLIIQHLEHCKIFTPHSDRFHPSFPTPKDVLHSIDQTTLVHWMVAHIFKKVHP